jgi:carboxyl-terminal processing protease
LLFAASLLPAQDELPAQMKSMIQAYAILEQNAADPISSEQALFQGAIPGLLRKLDPHSVFFDKDQFEQLKKMEASTQKGFGSVVSLLPGRVIVLQALPGTPSAKAGLQAGDEMVAVNGYDISKLDVEQITQLLSQSRQQQAQIYVRRQGEGRVLLFTLVPEDMQAPSVDRAFFIGAGIGYIRVSSFDENTGKDIKAGNRKARRRSPARARARFPKQSGGAGDGGARYRVVISQARAEDRDGARTACRGQDRNRIAGREALRLQTRDPGE